MRSMLVCGVHLESEIRAAGTATCCRAGLNFAAPKWGRDFDCTHVRDPTAFISRIPVTSSICSDAS